MRVVAAEAAAAVTVDAVGGWTVGGSDVIDDRDTRDLGGVAGLPRRRTYQIVEAAEKGKEGVPCGREPGVLPPLLPPPPVGPSTGVTAPQFTVAATGPGRGHTPRERMRLARMLNTDAVAPAEKPSPFPLPPPLMQPPTEALFPHERGRATARWVQAGQPASPPHLCLSPQEIVAATQCSGHPPEATPAVGTTAAMVTPPATGKPGQSSGSDGGGFGGGIADRESRVATSSAAAAAAASAAAAATTRRRPRGPDDGPRSLPSFGSLLSHLGLLDPPA